ncbi:MAG: GTP-binding protein, partial [Firmicutes bacterium]|nr:GTP-binding protein [Bacillota bacterium]
DRAIVTDIPGTTRDTIEESVSVDGILVKFTDTAGMRETADPIERIGVERSRNALALADLVLFVLDASRPLDAEDRSLAETLDPRRTLVLLNKTDVEPAALTEADVRKVFGGRVFAVSVKTGEGLPAVRKAIVSSVLDGTVSPGNGLVITSLRQKESLERATSLLDDAIRGSESGEALDVIETDVRAAWEALGEIVGETASEDIVDRVFERFCLGK